MVIQKPIDLPADVAERFVEDMRAFYAEEDATKQDLIAVHQLNALREHLRPRDKKLRLEDVKEMFEQMKQLLA